MDVQASYRSPEGIRQRDDDELSHDHSVDTNTSGGSSTVWSAHLRDIRLDIGECADEKAIPDGDLNLLSALSVHSAIGQTQSLKSVLRMTTPSSPNRRDNDGDRVPLHWAAARGHMPCVEMLLQAGADANVPDASGATPLELAERCGHETVAFLLRYEASRTDSSSSHLSPHHHWSLTWQVRSLEEGRAHDCAA
jgi:ankyrin repeat protein